MQLALPARRPTTIGLTPLIDVVFILLVFFMLATRFIDLGQQPFSVAVTDPIATEQRWLRIEVRVDQRVELDGKLLALAALPAALEQASPAPVYISSDDQATLDQILAVTDLVRQAGLADIHLELLP